MCGCHDFESAPLCFAGGVGLGPGRLLRDQLIPATQVGSLTSVNNSELGMDTCSTVFWGMNIHFPAWVH